MKLRSELTALLILLTFALIPVVGMVAASRLVLLPPALSVARMTILIGALLTLIYISSRRAFSRTAIANALGLSLLLVGLYPLVKAMVGRDLPIPEFHFASGYLALCVISALVPPRLSSDAQKSLFVILGTIASVFLVFAVVFVGWTYRFRQPYSPAAALAVTRLSEPLVVPRSITRRPDVFHLVLDGMGRPDVLAERYGMRLDAAIEQFRTLGFQIDPSIGHANYVQTHLSIPSMLNVTYLDALAQFQRSTNDQEPLRSLISQARVPRVFKQLGYRVEFIGGGSLSEGAFKDADVCDCPQLWFFEPEIGSLSLTPLKVFLGYGIGHAAFFRRALDVFDSFARQRTGSAPRYVYAHVLLPHPPFVVDEHGKFRNPRRQLSGADASFYPGSAEEYTASYRAQATFVLRRALEAATRVLDDARRNQREAIVIISGDHGPRLGLNAAHPTPESGRFTLPIWLAIRWTAHMAPDEPPKSLVNVYRTLFSRVFGMDLPPLPDRGYVSGFNTPYDLIPVDMPETPRYP
jgi:Sulfatase